MITAPASPKLEHKFGVITILKTDPIIIVKKLIICVTDGLMPILFFQKSAYYLTPINVSELINLCTTAPIRTELNSPSPILATTFDLFSFFSFVPDSLI